MTKIDYTELGATLFVPATHKDILSIIEGVKYPTLKSVVIDTEDGVDDARRDDAKRIVKKLVRVYKKTKLLVFVRPANVEVLEEFFSYDTIEKIDGFILPKFSLNNADSYLHLLKNTQFSFMPSIEGSELFDTQKLMMLRDKLLTFTQQIILVRFGLEDMLRQLSMKRSCEDSIFDFAVTNTILGGFLAIFKTSGFGVSGGVYPYFHGTKGFVRDVKRDLKEGLFSKTIIHPSQIDVLHELYKVTQEELDDAKEILENSLSIINLNGTMGEGKTMSPHAQLVVKRAEIYGVVKSY